MSHDSRAFRTAEALRRDFDLAFAAAPVAAIATTQDVLAIQVGDDPYAIQLTEISGLFADKRVMRVPSSVSELVGIAGFKGGLLPVYDLSALLGGPRAEALRWLVVTATKTRVALAFKSFESHLRVVTAAIEAIDDGVSPSRPAHGIVRTAEGMRPIIDIPAVLKTIEERSRSRT